jgi:hypothetical protein
MIDHIRLRHPYNPGCFKADLVVVQTAIKVSGKPPTPVHP